MTASEPSPVNEQHPFRGEWRSALPSRWGGHVSPQFLLIILIAHAVVLGSFCSDWDRVRLLLYAYTEVPAEPDINRSPEELAARWRYEEDSPGDLASFRPIAARLGAGIPDAGVRGRRLADYIYALRIPAMDAFDEDVRYGPAFLLARMQEGRHANCGQMSTVLATFWRSLGGHTRAVRWGDANGSVGHKAME